MTFAVAVPLSRVSFGPARCAPGVVLVGVHDDLGPLLVEAPRGCPEGCRHLPLHRVQRRVRRQLHGSANMPVRPALARVGGLVFAGIPKHRQPHTCQCGTVQQGWHMPHRSTADTKRLLLLRSRCSTCPAASAHRQALGRGGVRTLATALLAAACRSLSSRFSSTHMPRVVMRTRLPICRGAPGCGRKHTLWASAHVTDPVVADAAGDHGCRACWGILNAGLGPRGTEESDFGAMRCQSCTRFLVLSSSSRAGRGHSDGLKDSRDLAAGRLAGDVHHATAGMHTCFPVSSSSQAGRVCNHGGADAAAGPRRRAAGGGRPPWPAPGPRWPASPARPGPSPPASPSPAPSRQPSRCSERTLQAAKTNMMHGPMAAIRRPVRAAHQLAGATRRPKP